MYGLICAMDDEVRSFITNLKYKKEQVICGVHFYKGKLFNKDVVVVKCGMGKVNAALSTTLMLEHFNVDLLINIGLCGGNGKYLKIGDFVVSDYVCYHDANYAFNGETLYGQVQGFPLLFKADKKAVSRFKKFDKDIIVGGIMTGDTTVTNQKWIKERLDYFESVKDFKPLCFDMESAAIAQICYTLKTPFVVLRYVSDVTKSKDQNKIYFSNKARCADILVEACNDFLSK